MIVVGVEVHKHSLTAVAVDEAGRQLDGLETADGEELVAWSKRLGRRRLRALEDCRHVTRALERTLLPHRQRLVRVPPTLTAPDQRRGRVPGKSDLIDALAIARSALREPLLDSPPARGGAAAGAEAAGRLPRRPRRRATPSPAAAALAPARARPDASGPTRCPRPHRLAGAALSSAQSAAADHPGADRTRAARPLPPPQPRDRRT